MSRASLRQRLDKLVAIVRPPRGIEARLERLTGAQRAIYDGWRVATARWIARRGKEPGAAYAAVIGGAVPPMLPVAVRDTLFGPQVTIPAGATVQQASDAYRRALEDGR